jgi:hypothetical protein
MNTGHKELQDSLKKYYKDMNEFIRQKQIQEGLAKLRELSNKANNK